MSRFLVVLVGFFFIGSQVSAVDCPVLSNQLLGSYCAGKKFFGLNKMPEGLYDENGVQATVFLDKCPFFLFNIGKKKMYGSTRTAEVIGQTVVPWNRNTVRFLNNMKINPAEKDQYEVKHCKYELRHEPGSKRVKQAHIFVVGEKTLPQNMGGNVGVVPQMNFEENRSRVSGRAPQPIFEHEPIQEQSNEPFMNPEENTYREPENYAFDNNGFDNNGLGGESNYPLSNAEPEPTVENNSEPDYMSFAPPPPPPPPSNGFGEEGNGSFAPPPPPPPLFASPTPPSSIGETDGNRRGFLNYINKGVGQNLKPVDRTNQPPKLSGNEGNLGGYLGDALKKRRGNMGEDEDLNNNDDEDDSDFGSSNYTSSSNYDTSPMIRTQQKQPLSKPIVGTGKKWMAPSTSSSEPSRGNLLDQIRGGKKLKQVEPESKKPEAQDNTGAFNTDILNKVKQHQNPNEGDDDDDNEGWDD